MRVDGEDEEEEEEEILECPKKRSRVEQSRAMEWRGRVEMLRDMRIEASKVSVNLIKQRARFEERPSRRSKP